MSRTLDPKEFGLHPTTVLQEMSKGHIAIVISRKSRIIMSDGKKILDKAVKIKEVKPDCNVSLKTSTPLCSKTRAFLEENGIEVV